MRKTALALIAKMDSETLYEFARAAIRVTRPDAGLLWGNVAATIHQMFRGDSPTCATCPNNLTSSKLHERMREHAECAEWETEWNVADEMRTHEEIHCRPCPYWGKGRP